MGVHIVDKNLVITTEPKAFCFELPKDVGNSLNHEIYCILKRNEYLAEHTIKYEFRELLSKYRHGNDIHDP